MKQEACMIDACISIIVISTHTDPPKDLPYDEPVICCCMAFQMQVLCPVASYLRLELYIETLRRDHVDGFSCRPFQYSCGYAYLRMPLPLHSSTTA